MLKLSDEITKDLFKDGAKGQNEIINRFRTEGLAIAKTIQQALANGDLKQRQLAQLATEGPLKVLLGGTHPNDVYWDVQLRNAVDNLKAVLDVVQGSSEAKKTEPKNPADRPEFFGISG